MFSARLEQNTRRNGVFGLPGTTLTRLGTGLTRLGRFSHFSHLVRPGRTTLVRAVHRCRLTEFKSWQRLFKARDLSIFEIPLHTNPESLEKERKRAKEQGEKKKEEGRGENRRINLFSTPDLRSSFIMPLFISLFVFLDRSMTCE